MAFDNPDSGSGGDGGNGKGYIFVKTDLLYAWWLSIGQLQIFRPVRAILRVNGQEVQRTDGMLVSTNTDSPEF